MLLKCEFDLLPAMLSDIRFNLACWGHSASNGFGFNAQICVCTLHTKLISLPLGYHEHTSYI